jgi:hypothetical protein
MTNWNDFDHCFCEGFIDSTNKNIYNIQNKDICTMPEYLNTYSSLIIIVFGLIGLFGKHNSTTISILYSLLTVIGFGSTMYHYTGYRGWAYLDEIPMLLSFSLGTIYIIDIYYSLQKIYNLFLKKLLYLIIISLMMTFLCLSIMDSHRTLFPLYFIIIVIICLQYFYKINKILYKENFKHTHYLRFKNYVFYLTLFSSIIWITTEKLCYYTNNKILLIGHPIWHISSSYGAYVFIQIILYLKKFKSTNVSFKKNGIYYFLPIIDTSLKN